MRAVRTVLAVVAALVTSMSIPLAPAEADPDADLASQLDAAIEARIAAMGIPGAIVSLQIPGRISYDKAFGAGDTATGVPMLVDDHTRIDSVTKRSPEPPSFSSSIRRDKSPTT